MATILYGNGINRLHPDAPSWENMLKKLETKSNVSLNIGIPPTIQYDKIEIISRNYSSFHRNSTIIDLPVILDDQLVLFS